MEVCPGDVLPSSGDPLWPAVRLAPGSLLLLPPGQGQQPSTAIITHLLNVPFLSFVRGLVQQMTLLRGSE
jgi:hypothetical protein